MMTPPRPVRSTRLPLYSAALLGLLAAAPLSQATIGQRFPSEKTTLVDRITGVPLTVLTTAPCNDAKIYPTHPQWTSDGRYIIFRSSDRMKSEGPQAFAVNELTGEIIQVTGGPGNNMGALNIARNSQRLFLTRGGGKDHPEQPVTLIEINLETLLKDSAAGTLKDPSAYERTIFTLPSDLQESGGFGLDADEGTAFMGVRTKTPPPAELSADAKPAAPGAPAVSRGDDPKNPGKRPGIPQVPSKIIAINLSNGQSRTVVDTPFTMGHVQTNPFVPGEIVYCNETGGDAPQRMWTVRGDGSGNRPLYKETPDEWITHEAVITKDEVAFAIMGHLPRLRLHPHGLAIINLRDDSMRILAQAPEERGFWHVNGSADGRWAVGDTFEGTVYLIDRHTNKLTLLTADHKMQPDHTHPTFSPDSRRILIQSGMLSDGKSLDLMVIPVPQ